MTEYTLVFRRATTQTPGARTRGRAWTIARPATPGASEAGAAEGEPIAATDPPQLFLVPICSALGLDGVAYELFLLQSGVLEQAVRRLGILALKRPGAIVTARKQVQALVMAAEVQHIVARMSA
jgi:hypothetical protein